MTWRVLIACPHLQRSIDRYRPIFTEHGVEIELPPVAQQLTEAELLPVIDRFDGVIAGDDQFTARVLERAVRLKVIAKWGIGIDGIDLAAAQRRGIRVVNTPGTLGDEVADVVMGYMVLLVRQLHRMDRAVRAGEWLQIRGTSLGGKTLGIVGVGSAGQAVARRAVAAGMAVMGYDVRPVAPDFIRKTGLKQVGLDDLLQSADFISLNCNLTTENRHLLNPRTFALMKPGVYIINTSRGPLIDEAALAQALTSGQVAGAALDVFEIEPLPAESPLRQFDACIFGTHNTSNTYEAVERVNELAIRNLLDGLAAAL